MERVEEARQDVKYSFAPRNLRNFLLRAEREHVHLTVPSGIKAAWWFDTYELLEKYFSTNSTWSDIAKRGSGGECLRRRARKLLGLLRENSSEETQKDFPLVDVLHFGKPFSDKSRYRSSASQNGALVVAAPLFRAGMSAKEIVELTGRSFNSVTSVAYHERRLGKLPKSAIQRNRELRHKIKQQDLDDFDARQLLISDIPISFYWANKDLFVTLSMLCDRLGLNVRLEERPKLIAFLRSKGIPVGCVLDCKGNYISIVYKQDASELEKRNARAGYR